MPKSSPNVTATIDSYSVITNALPDLITSNDQHDTEGAVIAAHYLQSHDGSGLYTDNLVGTVSNVASDVSFYGAIEEAEQIDPGSVVDRAVSKIANRFFNSYTRKRHVAEALFSLAEYKLAHGDWTSFNQASVDFSRAMDVAGGIVKSRMIQYWLKPHFTEIATEDSIFGVSKARRIGALAAYQVYKENSLDPGDQFATTIVYGKHLKRMRQDISMDDRYRI